MAYPAAAWSEEKKEVAEHPAAQTEPNNSQAPERFWPVFPIAA